MGADRVYVFFGVRQLVSSDEELEQLERRSDPRFEAARKARLQVCLDRPTDGEAHFLLIGTRIGTLGVEDASQADLSETEFHAVAASTRAKLKDAGFPEEPKLHFQLVAQY